MHIDTFLKTFAKVFGIVLKNCLELHMMEEPKL